MQIGPVLIDLEPRLDKCRPFMPLVTPLCTKSGVLKVQTMAQNPDCQRVPSGPPVGANKTKKLQDHNSLEIVLCGPRNKKFEYPCIKLKVFSKFSSD